MDNRLSSLLERNYPSWFSNRQSQGLFNLNSATVLNCYGEGHHHASDASFKLPFLSITEIAPAQAGGRSDALHPSRTVNSALRAFPKECMVPACVCTAGANAESFPEGILFSKQGGRGSNVVYQPVPLALDSSPQARDFSLQQYTRNPESSILDVAGKFRWSELGKPHNFVEESEMHEDTEDINALLSSDESEDADVISTGHSPVRQAITMKTEHEGCPRRYSIRCELPAEDENEDDDIISTGHYPVRPAKMRRFDSNYRNSVEVQDTASSMKPLISSKSEYEDDADRCSVRRGDMVESFPPPDSRKVMETIHVLRSIIPDGKSKDAVVILDEAIRYLKFLRENAEVLGYPNFW